MGDVEPGSSGRANMANPAQANPGDRVWVTSEGVVLNRASLAVQAIVHELNKPGRWFVYIEADGRRSTQGWGNDGVYWDEASAARAGRLIVLDMIQSENERHARAISNLLGVLTTNP